MAIKVLEIHHTGFRIDTEAQKMTALANTLSADLGIQIEYLDLKTNERLKFAIAIFRR